MFSECLEVQSILRFFFEDGSLKAHHASISYKFGYISRVVDNRG